MSDLIGQSLGRYHILEQLGEGGMATVYKAYDTRLETDVAVKVIRRGAFPPDHLEKILKRFEREAKALAKLSHPNIIKVIDYGKHDGSPYLVVEYMPGGTLRSRLGRPIPWQGAVQILIPLAKALEYAHKHNIVHRDVKPSNILLTDKGQPMLTDFGIAKILEIEETATLTGTGIGVGTPEYMAPEQWMGSATAQSDIYSLGIVFYEMVTGRKPYVADTPAAILLKQATEPLPRPTMFVPDLPESVEKVLIKALAKNPQDRYQDTAKLTAAMEKLVGVRHGERASDSSSEFSTLAGDTYTIVQQEDSRVTRMQEATYDTRSESVVRGHVQTPRVSNMPEKKRKQAIPMWVYTLGAGLGSLVILLLCIGIALSRGIVGGSSDSSQIEPPPFSELQTEVVLFPTDTLSLPSSTEIQILPTDMPTLAPTFTFVPINTTVPSPTSKPISNPTGKIVYTCQISGNSDFNDICIMNADGSDFNQLTDNGANNGWPSFSPDGSMILFSSNKSGTWQIYSMASSGGSLRQLTFGADDAFGPDMSPNGQIVYKIGTPEADSIWVMNSDGSGAYHVYGNGWDPVWSPDGSKILFASGEFNSAQLYIINANGSGLMQLTNMANIRGRSDWSIQNLIAFYAGPSWQRNLYIIGSDGSNLTQLTNGGNSQAPSFSPDGEWIVFTGYFDNMNNDNGCEIYIIRIDGSDRQRLTSNSYCDWQPRWGP
ncbi:MAG: protein kinase domain-containing protein [Chloroflexota bacterium]